MTIRIDSRSIGTGHEPYVIAELSANHSGEITRAFDIMNAAKKSGASAVKIQTYRPDTITLNSDQEDFLIVDGLWKGRTLYDLYEEAHTPWEWHADLFQHARTIGITLFSSPFDTTAVDLLEDLNTPAYKIASFEVIDLPLIRYVAATGKPMIMSTGMADLDEIEEAVDCARDAGCKDLALLHCVSGYPAPASDYNLKTLVDLHSRYGLVTGLSDHTLDNTTAIAAVALGASIIEKHMTLDRSAGGPDDSFSLEPAEFADLCTSARTAWSALGKIDYTRKSSEVENVKFRRSLYFVEPLPEGAIITKQSVRSVRPGYGAAPKFLDEIIGKRVKSAVQENTPVDLENIDWQ